MLGGRKVYEFHHLYAVTIHIDRRQDILLIGRILMRKFIWLFLMAGATACALAVVAKANKGKNMRHIKRKKHEINTWENEGGSLATPHTAR